MAPKHKPMTPKEVLKRLKSEGWYEKRKGPGDHVQFAHPTKPGRVTVDTQAKEFPTGTLRSVFRQAGWDW